MEEIISKNRDMMQNPIYFKNIFNENENNLIENITKIIQNYEQKGAHIIVRFSGGWVRDKLIGVPNDDIDITVEGIDNLSFGKQLIAFYPTSTKYGIFRENEKKKNKEIKRLTVSHVQLASNFEIDICDIQFDPNKSSTMKPIEYDAKQRDLTINSLYYNINTFEIEDFVDGIHDLLNKIIRTPSSIDILFSKDPHCFLRAYRLAARFGFAIQEEILHPNTFLLEKFKENLKWNQVVKELMKTVKTSNVIQVLDWISGAQLFKLIFDPQNKINLDYNKESVKTALERFEKMTSNDFIQNLIQCESERYEELCKLTIFEDILNAKLIVVLSSIYYQNNNQKLLIPKTLSFPHEITNSVKKIINNTRDFINIQNKELNIYAVGAWLRMIGKDWLISRTLLSDENLLFFDTVFIPFVFENKFENIFNFHPILNNYELCKMIGIDLSNKKCREDNKLNESINKIQIDLIKWQMENPFGTVNDYKLYISSK